MARRQVNVPPDQVDTKISRLEIQREGDLVTLYVDGVESSAIDINDPHHLEFEYMQHIRIVLNAAFPVPEPLRILHLGAAACALPRALNADRPGSKQLAIELDSELSTLAREWFDLPASPALRIRAEDGRTTLDTNKGSWNAIIRDAFRQGRIPAQLATIEAHQNAARLLADGGVYLLNVAGEAGLVPVYREIRALKLSFGHIFAIADPAIMKNRRFGNVIIVASQRPLPRDIIERQVRKLPLPTIVVDGKKLDEAAKSVKAMTDADAGWDQSEGKPSEAEGSSLT